MATYQREVTEEDLKNRFPLFLAFVWQYLQLPPPTPKQTEMAEWLQEGVPNKRQILCAFRGIGKSWITCVYVVWRLWRDPQEKILVLSSTGQRAMDFTIMAQRLIIEIDFLQHLQPDSSQKQHRWSKLSFDVAPTRVAQSPSVKSAGINGTITGSRATLIVPDDIESPENSATVDAREKLVAKFGETEAILLPEGEIVCLGTFQTEESIYNTLRQKGYTTRIWPARVPSEDKVEAYGGCLAPSIERLVGTREGRPTDTRFSHEDLVGRELFWGRSAFALQFMMDTTLSDAERYPLKTADIIVSDSVDIDMGPSYVEWSRRKVDQDIPQVGFSSDRWYAPVYNDQTARVEYEGRIMFIDPSGRGADECVAIIMYQLHGKLFLADIFASKDGYGDDTLRSMARLAKRHKVQEVVIEANFGDGMFEKLLGPIMRQEKYPCKMTEVKHSQQKEARIIDTLEPVLNQHRLVIDRRLIIEDAKLLNQELTKPYSLFHQLTRLTRERGALRHDDRLDALAGAVAYWVDSMGRDSTVAHNSHLTDAAERSTEEFERIIKEMDQKDTSGTNRTTFSGPKSLAKGWLGSFQRGGKRTQRRC